MRRLICLLSLIATLTGPLLRLTEASDDWRRAIASAGSGTHLAEVDGGVGDDSGVTIQADDTHKRAPSRWVDLTATCFLAATRLPKPAQSRSTGVWSDQADSSPTRCSLLQCFRC